MPLGSMGPEPSDDKLVITDPFLLFYMKWAENHDAPGVQLPLIDLG